KALVSINHNAGRIIKRSDVFVTAAWGNEEQPDFYNQAVHIETELSAHELLKILLKTEEELGRKRTAEKWQERTIDIDILFYNENTINTEELKIPHPFLQDRKFVLIPMMQIAKDLIHPVLKKTIGQLLIECTDKLEVKKL
ncbi:MAG: 2-amino-4-hydroxy-6-hydroxymethyldihydropteridine diphosphokinase, partial [Bacteroidia bacterium]